ncbi:MAG TPA: pyridoxamine 5'-phosphate oxidase family protein [Mycobacteriales bacterium]|jgi:hypothetical protein|nr:pyridoxamine 5'-phosphate oxidase family protein [Mycobacteriales bacterium]
MATWAEVVVAAPELAAAVRERFAVRKHATMATLRRDGSPRISGTEVEFDGGDVVLGSMSGAVKARDLLRDPRVAIHSPTVDPDPGDPSAWPGEAKLAGLAVEVPTEDAAHRFAIDVREVVLTRVSGDRLVVESWHPGRGVERRERA